MHKNLFNLLYNGMGSTNTVSCKWETSVQNQFSYNILFTSDKSEGFRGILKVLELDPKGFGVRSQRFRSDICKSIKLNTLLMSLCNLHLRQKHTFFRAGEPEPELELVGAGRFWLLGAGDA